MTLGKKKIYGGGWLELPKITKKTRLILGPRRKDPLKGRVSLPVVPPTPSIPALGRGRLDALGTPVPTACFLPAPMRLSRGKMLRAWAAGIFSQTSCSPVF